MLFNMRNEHQHNPAVAGAACRGAVVSDRILGAFALRNQPGRVDLLGLQVGGYGLGPFFRQLDIILKAAG